MENIEDDDHSFKSWLLSKHALVEKTFGAVVLAAEIIGLVGHILSGVSKLVLTQILNLSFLIFIYRHLKAEFAKRYSVAPDSPEVASILRFPDASKTKKGEISALVNDSNILISQLENINYFILITAGLYLVLLTESAVQKLQEQGHLLQMNKDFVDYFFHFPIDLLSYAGAFYLLRCFFVMYETTIDKTGKEILRDRTQNYVFAGFILMVVDTVLTVTNAKNGIFISEFICGVVNAVILILLVARFENKILDIPPWVLGILYVYAILQTCLPFVSGNFLAKESQFKHFSEEFGSIVLTLCLVGKVTLSAVLLYVLGSRRIFYYFMTLRKIHEEEEEHWGAFRKLITDFREEPEMFSLIYARQDNSLYMATIPNLFPGVEGEGTTTVAAKKDLIMKIERAGKSPRRRSNRPKRPVGSE
jgi:hypothetical protein